MPKKVGELKRILRKAGFSEKSGKGSHTKWTHPLLSGTIVVSGRDARALHHDWMMEEAGEAGEAGEAEKFKILTSSRSYATPMLEMQSHTKKKM